MTEESQFNETPSNNSRMIIAVGAACLLFVGGCVVCGGGLALPFVIRSQRRLEEVRRAQVEHNLQQIQEAMRTKAAQEAAEHQDAAPGGSDSTEAGEP